jgi:hypothetical protein
MDYINLYESLRNQINPADNKTQTDGADIYHFTFESKATSLLPGKNFYRCTEHAVDFDNCHPEFKTEVNEDELMLHNNDIQINSNKRFRYAVFMPKGVTKTDRFIFMFHGFNEKSWEKYYPWAQRLTESTGKAVLLFPIAFHMDRAPQLWSSRYEMFELSKKRKQAFPCLLHSTFSNVAISIHIHARPQRFIWSGLQTYYDVIQLMEKIDAGDHPLFEKGSRADFFAYSIGGLLAKSLLMTNTKGYFSDSKLCLFCSGAAFNRLQAASKFIIDSRGSLALYSYLIEHLDYHIKTNPRLAHYLSEAHPEGHNLKSLLNYNKMREYREGKFREIGSRMTAFVLKQDTVYPYFEVENMLKGVAHHIPVPVHVLDFPFPYKHEDPFPVNKKYRQETTRHFEETLAAMGAFLSD